ncbi:MAG TPA: RsmB/NOP family class I SAM-dependent RNA methyltransferase [Burkholderiaceae bacterium]|nr:RsmB/NOP family class I SAM-dependent RNA methyltransferase [Burkholderiaceae bacterium]
MTTQKGGGRQAAAQTARGHSAAKKGGSSRPASQGKAGRGGRAAPVPEPDRNYVPAIARIEQVRNVLGEILQWQHPADQVLSRWLRAHSRLGVRDRAEVTEAVFNVLRHLRLYRNFAESGSGPAARRLAILGLDATLPEGWLEPGLDEQEKAWLAHIRRIDREAMPRTVRESLPDWLEERLSTLPDSDSLVRALNQPAPLDIRVNPFKVSREDVLAAFAAGPAARFNPVPTPYSPWGIRFEGRPTVSRWPAFEKGEIEVQDEGSQILVALMAPRRGEMIIDFCAGAGGKTLLLGALMRSTGRLYAFDVSHARLARAKPRFARSGLSNIVPVVIEPSTDQRVKRLRGKAQRVLVDAPCSGLGTLRRNPDLKWRQHPEVIEDFQRLQQGILREAATCVAPGGRLVYATCSLLPEENEAQIEAFLKVNADFQLLNAADIARERCPGLEEEGPYLRLRPDRHGTDGFFAAVLQRNKAET